MSSCSIRWAVTTGLLTAVLVVAGCTSQDASRHGGRDQEAPMGPSAGKPSQVAARVNGEELTVHQINDRLLAWGGGLEDARPEAAGVGRTLTRLVELTLLRQEAEAQGLAHKPEVLRALQAARAEVLARAWAQQIGEEEQTPAPHQVRRYFDEHPQAFSRRRVFVLTEVRAPVAAGDLGAAMGSLQDHRQPQSLVRALEKAGVRAMVSHTQVASDQLTSAQLQQVQRLSSGQALQVADADTLRVWWVQSVLDQPIEWEQAQSGIERLLHARARAERVRGELERLRTQSRIEFVGDFTRWAPADDPAKKAGGEGAQGVSSEASAR